MYLFVFFETHSDRVILVPLGATDFDELMVVNEVTYFGKFAVCNGVILSGN